MNILKTLFVVLFLSMATSSFAQLGSGEAPPTSHRVSMNNGMGTVKENTTSGAIDPATGSGSTAGNHIDMGYNNGRDAISDPNQTAINTHGMRPHQSAQKSRTQSETRTPSSAVPTNSSGDLDE